MIFKDYFYVDSIRGKNVKVPHSLNFSFCYTIKENSINEEFYVGVSFNSNKIDYIDIGILNLNNWIYVAGKYDENILEKNIIEMKQFFKTYINLFKDVWESKLPSDTLRDYFCGYISYDDLCKEYYAD